MQLRINLAAIVILLFITVSAKAVGLVVMAENTTAIPGDTVFTVGIEVTAFDVAAGGSNPVLAVQDITFSGGANGPIQALSFGNQPNVQSVQSLFINASAENYGGPPGPLSLLGNNAFYKDSWWYNSPGGTLQGVIDSAGDVGLVTTAPASDGSGVYTLGAPNSGTTAVGVTGYTFTPAGAAGMVPANATTGQTMIFSGTFGPAGANYWSPSPGGPFTDPSHVLGDLLVQNGGQLTVPLAQIVGAVPPIWNGNASDAIPVPQVYNNGAGTFIAVGTQSYGILGYAPSEPFGTFLPPPPIPEPSSIVLSAFGVALCLAVRWRRRSSSCDRS